LKGDFGMINQKGQAFSVFELMIAGVVAFAILMVLMQVIGGVLTGTDVAALSAISAAVSSASPSGQASAGSFILEKQIEIGVEDLASETDLDRESFIFTMGEFTAADSIDTDGTYLKYSGSQPKKKISATIICKQTNADLEAALGRIDSSKQDVSLASSGCPNDGIVCCVIIPTKSTK
jgi:hypothetical protein